MRLALDQSGGSGAARFDGREEDFRDTHAHASSGVRALRAVGAMGGKERPPAAHLGVSHAPDAVRGSPLSARGAFPSRAEMRSCSCQSGGRTGPVQGSDSGDRANGGPWRIVGGAAGVEETIGAAPPIDVPNGQRRLLAMGFDGCSLGASIGSDECAAQRGEE